MINLGFLIPFFSGKCGGSCIGIKEIVPYLERMGVNTKVYASSSIAQKGKERTEIFEKKSNGFTIYRFNTFLRFREYRISFKLLPHLLKNSKNIDILHSHTIRSFQEDIGTLISIGKKIPLIITPNGAISINWDYSDKIPKMIHDKTIGYLRKKLVNPHYIAIAKNEIPIIKNYGISDDHIHYIPPGVNTDFFKPVDSSDLKKKYNLENSDIILYLGRIVKGKGVDKLIKILNFIVKKNKNVKLVIVGGDAGYLPIVKSLILKYNLTKYVIFVGYALNEDLPKYYSMADLVIYPSRQEIFGLVICEAAACGKPVIGSNIMGPSEIIVNGKTGYTSDFKNLNELSEKIIELLNDKKLLVQMGNNGLQRVKKEYSWKINAESHFRLYKKILK